MRCTLVAAVLGAALVLAGCANQTAGVPQASGDGAKSSASTAGKPAGKPAADPKALISNAAKSTRDASTAKFEYTMDGAKEADLGMKFASKGEMDFKANRAKIESVVETDGQKVTMSIVTDGDTLYMRTTTDGAEDGPWTKTDAAALAGQLGGGKTSPGSDPMSFIDQIKDLATVTPDGTEAVRGVQATRYRLVPNAGGEELGDSKIWIDGQNRLVRFQVGAKTFGSITAEFFDYGAPVSIEIPKVG
ncbi:hypothetical protein [Actinocrispum sp. NPDC049592]|uniref:DUF7537 family lipoprotein n=1 Tax=Actinocrispum sp. NPDC049592 TaxID=3154835 RepID=UPI003424989D